MTIPETLGRAPVQSPEQQRTYSQTMTPWLWLVLAVVLFAGGLFGYDQGVISGALGGIKSTFTLSPLMIEVVTSWVTLGALFGSLAGGELADRFGRERTMLIAGAMFTLGALVQAFAPGTAILVAGRLVVGAGVGAAAVAAPLYAAELAPAAVRGRFVSCYQLAITIGLFLGGWLSESGAWRVMLGASAVPALLLFAVALAAPKSPRWLMTMGRRSEAAAELRKLSPGTNVEPPLYAIAEVLRQEGERASWGEVFHQEWRRPLAIGIGLAVFQQITGINAIIYYADQIFSSAGFTTPAAQTAVTTWAIGAVNVLPTLIAIAFIDRLGRRKLLLAGLIGMGISLIVVGAAFQFIDNNAAGDAAAAGPSAAGAVTLFALVGFIICFAFSMGPAVWTVINEVFPGRIRGRAVAVATAVNWGSAFLVSQFFLSVTGVIGNSLTFWLFALFCGIACLWIYFSVPETKGKSLEQIQQLWMDAGK